MVTPKRLAEAFRFLRHRQKRWRGHGVRKSLLLSRVMMTTHRGARIPVLNTSGALRGNEDDGKTVSGFFAICYAELLQFSLRTYGCRPTYEYTAYGIASSLSLAGLGRRARAASRPAGRSYEFLLLHARHQQIRGPPLPTGWHFLPTCNY